MGEWDETREPDRESFFTYLYERYYSMLEWMSYQQLNRIKKTDRIQEAEVQDVVEKTFQKMIPHYQEIRELMEAGRVTYLKNTLRCVTAGIRDNTTYELETIPLSALVDTPPMTLEEYDQYMKEKRERQGIKYVINKIKPEDLWLLYYKNMMKYSEKEIAAVVEIPEKYISLFIRRAEARVTNYMRQADFSYIRYEAKLRQQEAKRGRMDSNRYSEEQRMYELKRIVEVLMENAKKESEDKKKS